MNEVNRPLSPVERWYRIAEEFSALNVVARVRVHGQLDVPLLRKGLDAVQTRHPLLRATITPGADPAFVAGAPPIPLREASGDWVRETDERELAERLDLHRGPLARAVVVAVEPGVHDLLLTVSHCVADAITVLSLAREWVESAAGQVFGELPALPAPEDLFPSRHRALRGTVGAAARVLSDQRKLRRADVRRLVPTAPVPDSARRTRLVHRELSPEQLEALRNACRRHGSTVHGALAAAMVTAVARDAGVTGPCHYGIGSPIDFRGEVGVSGQDAGAYIATVPSFVAYRPDGDFWDMATAVSRDLALRRSRGDHFSVITLLRWACPSGPADSEAFRRVVAARGPGNLCLSNIGVHDFPDRIGPWRLSGAQFTTGLSISGYLAATVNTSHGALFWNFSHIDHAVPGDRARRIADLSVATALEGLA
ncbi:hypothetical protein ABZ816_26570 [Actinosynnema sp. NPDC047251]|uniref:Phthiocerol/phthiodiolone dimycocerosyl transferase n=1 Tax=Saccharothrix espanaensis (strain ATCC 51144 / DSM 44229 / JCM 9112 / NBRC 15066 / NRRL 15764) TaxID=1179773 RepID=K0JW42_SACES|nr:hypothetical protein [Saccharothrix espanaensis]CCH32045.1 hypothetical protein BN6_47700 [Saccharothrix espanaensis DSM 44229]